MSSVKGLGFLAAGCLALTSGAPDRRLLQAVSAQQTSSSVSSSPSSPRAVLDQYCVTCHNARLRTGGLALDGMDLTDVSAHTDVWEKVVRKLRAGLMPPRGRPRPDAAAYEAVTSWLETELDRAAAARPNPGRTEPFHRLNRSEYRTAIRDLLAVDVDVTSYLPADDGSYGFDNIAGVLRISPTLMERYLSAAQKISRVAIGTPALVPNAETFRVRDDLPQGDQIDGLPFGTRGGAAVRYTFPMDGEYVVQVSLARDMEENVPPFADPQQLEVSVDGEPVQTFTLPASQVGRKKANTDDGESGGSARQRIDADWRVRVPMKAGPHDITATFLNRTSALAETALRPFQRPYPGGVNFTETRSGAYLRSIEISGPFDATGAGDTPSRRRIFSCRPTSPSVETACAKTILSTLARRAYRRPVTSGDVQKLLTLYDEGRQEGGFDAGIDLALQRLLVSPEFLVRVERDPADIAPDTNYRISDLELASRLSFFLWSSLPDDELLNLASRGTLHEKAVLDQQVLRMLADARAQALVSNFAGQWLYLRNVPGVGPAAFSFPDFDESLRQAFRRETELFFDSIRREDRNVLDLLTADYTFLNERLARHYGIPNVHGTHFRRVTLDPGSVRGGLLGQGSILTVTSYATRTSPVVRGKWILENLLGTPPPPPPKDVPDLKATNAAGQVLSMRERMAQHRANPVCATCHSMMDPLGLALENFNAVGEWRTLSESSTPIDSAGILPDGTPIEGPSGLRQALVSHPDRFVGTLTEKLLTYALGRGIESYDAPAVRAIVHDAAHQNYRFSSIILDIVHSLPFQLRRSAS